jgi:acetylornithine deacetylase/succinyl-diaminopimelate desuccinylase family protein
MTASALNNTLAELIRLNTVNPAYGDGGTEENAIPFLRHFFQSRGIQTSEQEVFPGRHNLLAKLPGRTERRVVLEAHIDTVSIKGMTIPPFEPAVRNGRMYGRGSVDDKAGLAAMLHAVASLHEDGVVPNCEVLLAAVVDEEFSYRGVVKLCEELSADAAIVAEPTEMRVVVASKGVLRFRIHVRGKAAHSAKPHLGCNAITHMARLVLALEQEHQNLSTIAHPLLGPPTLNVGVIHGGVQVNFVPDHCAIEVDRRLLPGETATAVIEGYRQMLGTLGREIPGFAAEIEEPLLLVDEALDTPVGSPVVTTAQAVMRSLGWNPEVCGVPFGSDASKLSRAGIPTILFGPGSIDQAHSVDEYVDLEQVAGAAAFYRDFLLMFK